MSKDNGAKQVAVWRVDILGSDGKEWYALVNAVGEKDARREAKSKRLLLGDTITEVSGPFYWTSKAWMRHEHGTFAEAYS